MQILNKNIENWWKNGDISQSWSHWKGFFVKYIYWAPNTIMTKIRFLTAMKMRKTSILMINDKYSLKTHDESRKE